MGEPAPDSAETHRLLEEAGRGDQRALDNLFARHRSELRRFIANRMDRRMRARVDASDIVQEAQLEATRRLNDYLKRQPMPFATWLRKTAYERLLMHRRRHVVAAQRAVGREVPLPDRSSLQLAQRLFNPKSSSSHKANQRQLARQVRELLAQLPEMDREILVMRNVEELAYNDVACILGIDAATARKRHGRALLRLHRLLADNGPGSSDP